MQSPHILIFNPDQWRGDVLGHLGNPAAHTPNLDALVQTDAVSFSRAFCQLPICTPSRCSFMTGWYPHVRGHRTLHHLLQPDEPMLLRTLKQHGYYVWWGGKNHLIPRDADFGEYCDVYFHHTDAWNENPPKKRLDPANVVHPQAPEDRYSHFTGLLASDDRDDISIRDHDRMMVDAACDLIANRPENQPLCIYLPLNDPHPDYAIEEPWFSLIDREAIAPPHPVPDWSQKPSMLGGLYERQALHHWTAEQWREVQANYYGQCARMDHFFGMVVDALKQAGIYDNTVIFFFSDHGDFTGDYGLVEKNQNTFEDCLTRVPLIIKPPQGTSVQPGTRDALVELVDFSATVEALTGIEPGHTHFGRSLLPLLADPAAQHRDAVFAEGGRIAQETHTREAEHLPLFAKFWPRLSLQAEDDVAHGKATMCRTQDYKYVRRLYEPDELYDLNADPAELHNRIDDPALAGVLAEMRLRVLDFYQSTCDVVLHRTDQL